MHVLILDHTLAQGIHLKRGLKYENVDSDILLFHSMWHSEIHRYSAVIVHIMNVSDEVLASCLWLQQHYRKIPIIIIDDREVKCSREICIQKGASVYMGRPFAFRDLAAQIKFLVYKQRSVLEKKILSYEDLKLFLETREVQRNGTRVRLRNKEFALLEFLVLNKGQVLTRNEILENVWDRNVNILTNTVDVHVNSLRRKIESKSVQKLIHTVPCVGYRFGSQ